MQMNKNIIPMYCMCLTKRQGAETDQNTLFSPRGSAGRFRSSHSLPARQEQHREMLGAAEILRLCPEKRSSKEGSPPGLPLGLQPGRGGMLRAEPALLPRGCGPCCWGCSPVSWAKGGGRAEDFGVSGHDGAAERSAAGIPCTEGREGGTDRDTTQAQVRHLYT